MSAGQRRWGELFEELGTTSSSDVPLAPDACAEAIDQMFLYLDRELEDEGATHRIASHLGLCVDCVAAYDAEQLMRAVVARSCRGERASSELRLRIESFILAAGQTPAAAVELPGSSRQALS